MAIQTQKTLTDQLRDFLPGLEQKIQTEFQLKRVCNRRIVVVYFVPMQLALGNSNKQPDFFLAFRTYTKGTTPTVGPRVEIGVRDIATYGHLLKKLSPEWVEEDSDLYLPLDGVTRYFVLKEDRKMGLYNPESLVVGSRELVDLEDKIIKGAAEVKRIWGQL
jgi:hypothetical protein